MSPMSSNEPRKRLKAAESRRALLDAGIELLRSRGVAPGLDRVTLKEAIEMSGVPRSTAYRLYEGEKGQLEEFRADLLADLDNTIDQQPTLAAVDSVLHDNASALESQDPGKLADLLREIIRVSMATNLESVQSSLEWRVYMSSLASLGTGDEDESPSTHALQDAADATGEQFVEVFRRLANTFGLRLRDPYSPMDFSAAVSAIVEGVALHQHVEPRLANMQRPTGTGGELQPWNAAAVSVESLMLAMTEPDPAMTVSADLSAWTAF